MQREAAGGLTLPGIGLGTMRLHGDTCHEVVGAALAAGYRHLDTARKYDNEADVGAAMAASAVPRDQIVVTTKLPPDELAADEVARATESSLERLGTDYIDLLLIHWPNPDVPLAETLEAMAAQRERGTVRSIGVANFPTTLLKEALDTVDGLVTDQVEYHPYLGQAAVLDLVRAGQLVLTAYCPLARGALLDDPVLDDVAAGQGRTVAQVALRWLVQQDGVVAIPGTSRVERVHENLEVLDFTLTADEMTAIGALARGQRIVDPPHAPSWDAT